MSSQCAAETQRPCERGRVFMCEGFYDRLPCKSCGFQEHGFAFFACCMKCPTGSPESGIMAVGVARSGAG